MQDKSQPTRRAFVAGVAKKAVYVAPAVLALKAAQQAAADFTGCIGPTSPCTMSNECCQGLQCKRPDTSSCMGAMDCTCQ
ncbi:MAG: hypothetical protein ACYS0G_13160 [Planctomycetota bacterium]|jgi:hypothetical protein